MSAEWIKDRATVVILGRSGLSTDRDRSTLS
jgi:hypothetical protein